MNKKFKYTYTAPTEDERKEIEYIKSQYEGKTDRQTKLDTLRKLDGKVKNIPTCVSLILGILGLLIFGLGMAMILEWNLILFGVLIGLVGCIPIGLAYFAYTKLQIKLKEKHSEEILNLSRELLNENDKKEL